MFFETRIIRGSSALQQERCRGAKTGCARLGVPLLFFGLLLAVPSACLRAAEYRFSVPEAEVTVTLEESGAALIHYRLAFQCLAGAHPIDIVDIGMPNVSKHSPMDAAVDGVPLGRDSIRVSTYLKPRGCGYEIHLGSHTIQPGRQGVFEFTGREEGMVWRDTTHPEQASFRFTPTWFGSQYVVGDTKLILRYRLPISKADYPAMKDRILWHKKGQEFSVKGVMDDEETVSVGWVRTVRLTGKNEFGVSFPGSCMQGIRHDSIWMVFLRWFEGNKNVQVGSGIFIVVAFSVLYFLLTGGTGWSLFLPLIFGLVIGMVISAMFHLWTYPGILALAGLVWWLRHHRRKNYFPAELCIEGGGIKRGLTAVQAAVLLELPLEKVLTMLIFGLARKGVITIASRDPLRVTPCGRERSKEVWLCPDGKIVKLWKYEAEFLDQLQRQPSSPVHDLELKKTFDSLIQGVVKAMDRHSVEDTRAYYRSIALRAWRQVQKETDWEVRFQKLDKESDWLMLDNNCGGLFNEPYLGHHYSPWWWHGHSHGVYAEAVPSTVPTEGLSLPDTSFGDVANSVSGRLEGICSQTASSLDSLASSGGTLDLSSVDHFTSDVLREMNKGGGGGGGGSCACAGCACACACAGGGR